MLSVRNTDLSGGAVPDDTVDGSPHITSGMLNILGVRVSVTGVDRAAEQIVDAAVRTAPNVEPNYVCATSVHGLIVATSDREFRDILNAASMITPDGMPLVWWI